METIAERLDRYTEPEPMSGCWLWTGCVERKGYGRMKVRGKNYLVHRLAYQESFGHLPSDLCVMHKCDVPCCVNPQHLTLGTYADNNHDRDKKGRHRPMQGESNGGAKLTSEQVRDIRSRLSNGEADRALARAFGVSHRAIGRIKNGTHWVSVA